MGTSFWEEWSEDHRKEYIFWYFITIYLFKALVNVAYADSHIKHLVLEDNKWKDLILIQKFLKLFKEITTLISSSIYPTLSLAVSLFNSFLDHIEDTESAYNSEQAIYKAAEKSKKKLLECYNKTRAPNGTSSIPVRYQFSTQIYYKFI